MLPQFVVLKHPFVDSYLHITSIHDNMAIILSGLLSIWTLLILLQVPVDKYYLINYEPTLDVQNFFDSIREAVMSITGTDRVSITLAELSVQPQNVEFHIDPNNH